MGKQAFDKRVALANALSTSGVAVVPPAKSAPKESGRGGGKGKGAGRRKKEPSPEPAPKSKKEIEEEQRKVLEGKDLQKKAFYEAEAVKKVQERKGADASVTWVEDKDSRKPVAVSDISDYWRSDLGTLPFMPDDNVSAGEPPDGVDVHERLEYLRMLNEQLQHLLKMRFHVFWSQVIYDEQLRRCLDSYLRFSVRAHDLEHSEGASEDDGKDPVLTEERQVATAISRRMLAVFLRLSRPQETSHDFISDSKFGELIYEHGIFDVPKLIDLCSIYGDSNRTTVTRIAHSVFTHQPKYREDFKAVVTHMLGGLYQCCSPLQRLLKSSGGRSQAELSVDECLAFLPDILSCFNAIFCFFPEECVELLLGGSLALADLMVALHESVAALQKRSGGSSSDQTASVCKTTVSLLSRLLSCILGVHMSPRHGASAFDKLLEWLKMQIDRGALLDDLGKHGLDNVALDWLASGLVDDAQLDYLEQLCGPLLPKEARARRRSSGAAAPRTSTDGGGGGGAKSASSTSGQRAGTSSASATSDAGKIREVREVVGMDHGEGFVLQCLLHYDNSVPAVVGAIFDGSLPPQLAALPKTMALHQDQGDVSQPGPVQAKLSAEDKARIVAQASRIDDEAAEAGAEGRVIAEYDDDFDDGDLVPGFKIGGNQESDSDKSAESNASSSDEEAQRWPNSKGGRKGKGKGKGKSKDPVQGQTIQARRKEENKARVANHNRREGALRKMMKGM